MFDSLCLKTQSHPPLQPSNMLNGKKAKEVSGPRPCCHEERSRRPRRWSPAKRAKNFDIRQDIKPKRDLTYFVKRPHYILLQWQRTVLYKRLKVPPAVNQPTGALDRQTIIQLLMLAHKYRPLVKAREEAETVGPG